MFGNFIYFFNKKKIEWLEEILPLYPKLPAMVNGKEKMID